MIKNSRIGEKVRIRKRFILTVVGFSALIWLWLPGNMSRMVVWSCHLVFGKEITYGDALIMVPDNWAGIRRKGTVLLFREPLDDNSYFSVDNRQSFAVTKETVRNAPLLVTETGRRLMYEQTINAANVTDEHAFIAYTVLDNEFHAMFSIPKKKVTGVFRGNSAAFGEYVNAIREIRPINNKHKE